MKKEISIGGYYEGGERYHAEAVGEIEGRVPWASTHIHCITHLVVRMRISIMVIMAMMTAMIVLTRLEHIAQPVIKCQNSSCLDF